MSLPQIFVLSLVEIVGDYGLKQYANDNGISYLVMGATAYIGVVSMLIVSLQGSTLLMVNSAWDAMSTLLESAFAFFILGERLDNYYQYMGIFFIIVGVYLLKIPLTKSHPFYIPKS